MGRGMSTLRWACVALLLRGAMADASCLPIPGQGLGALDDRIVADPVQVLAKAGQELALAGPDDRVRRASLLAVQSEAYYEVERDLEARNAATAGLALLADRPFNDALKARLILIRADTSDLATDIADGVTQVNQVLGAIPANTLPYACGLLTRARLYQSENRFDLAVADALTMYRLTKAGNWAEPHALAAELVGSLYVDTGDFDEARRFLTEALDYEEGRQATNWLSVTHYFLGRLELHAGRYRQAVEQFRKTASLSVSIGDPVSVSMTRTASCIALTRSGDLQAARPLCEEAIAQLRGGDRPDLLRSAVAARADWRLASHDAAGAVRDLDYVLADGGAQISPRKQPEYFLARARARAVLGRYQTAYGDFSRFFELSRLANATDDKRTIAALRMRFETERTIEHERALQQEIAVQRELLRRRTEINMLWTGVATAGAAVIALLVYALGVRRRHARTLEAQTRILHSMCEGVMLLEPDGSLRCINEALAVAFGHGAEDFRTLELGALGIDVDPRKGPTAPFQECILRRKDGSEFPGTVTFTSMEPADPGAFICVIQDMSERKRLERALLDISSREQQHFGQELHDGLGQELTGLALLARGIAGEAGKQASPLALDLDRLATIASRAIETCRGMARGLSPASEVQGGLVPALQELTTRISATHGVQVRFQNSLDAPLAPQPGIDDHVYRIGQEAIVNAVKHSHARQVEVMLSASADRARLQIRDHGRGLVPADFSSGGLGLHIMRYRANLIGARFSIGPAQPSGTAMICEWPLMLHA